MTAYSESSFRESLINRDHWGRLVESAVGAHLWNSTRGQQVEIYYWRERNDEVDFVIKKGKQTVAIEVKSGRSHKSPTGMSTFSKNFHPSRKLLVSDQGMPLEEFLSRSPLDFF